jgi:Carboxypeptidase regulatory-like domain
MNFRCRVLRIVFLGVVFCAEAWAQNSGSISGTVKDPSGAAIPAAVVAVASPDHGINRQTVTNSIGGYNVFALPAGRYNVNVIAAGFKKHVIKENLAFEFRTEAFNVFNHPELNSINGGLGSPGFLAVGGAHNPPHSAAGTEVYLPAG